jgi:hypothetical protein
MKPEQSVYKPNMVPSCSGKNLLRTGTPYQGAAGTLITTRQQKVGRVTTPANGAKLRIELWLQLGSGWERVNQFKALGTWVVPGALLKLPVGVRRHSSKYPRSFPSVAVFVPLAPAPFPLPSWLTRSFSAFSAAPCRPAAKSQVTGVWGAAADRLRAGREARSRWR